MLEVGWLLDVVRPLRAALVVVLGSLYAGVTALVAKATVQMVREDRARDAEKEAELKRLEHPAGAARHSEAALVLRTLDAMVDHTLEQPESHRRDMIVAALLDEISVWVPRLEDHELEVRLRGEALRMLDDEDLL